MVEQSKWLSNYVCGRVLPVRFPIVKVEEGFEAGQSHSELLGFKYTQFIYMDDIKTFVDEENLEVIEADTNA